MTKEELISHFCDYRGKCTTDDVAALTFAYRMLASRWISVEDDIGIEGVQPITLTDEILAENFVVTDDAAYGKHYGYYNDFMEVDICEYTDGIWQVVVDEIEMRGLPTWRMYVENVHQLQQAFRLANIEKEIKL